ncbi:MAG TPA: hypothetical protein VIU86_15395, partial [Gaiellaceae bacterium]
DVKNSRRPAAQNGTASARIPAADFAGRKRVRIVRFPGANHFFLDGSGPSTPLEYSVPGHVDPKVAATVAAWIASRSD